MFVSLNFYPLNTRKHSDECTNKYVLLMMRIGVGLSLLMLTLCTSCTREVLTTDAANFGSDYFPLAWLLSLESILKTCWRMNIQMLIET